MSNVSGVGIAGEILSASIGGTLSAGSVILNEYVISVSDITGGHRITITNGITTQTIDVMNGEQGYAPVVSVNAISGGHRVSITDATHIANPHTFDVMNGTGAGDEMTTNKVTSISSSSTDVQYPSAKCVYDIVGNVESVLDSIIGGVS